MVLSAPGWADLPPLDLTPASRRQDHTTSPSALAPFVRMPFDRSQVKPALPSRHMPDAAASTASRSASVTIAIRPSVGRDGEGYRSDLGQAGMEIFLQPGLDSQLAEQPVGQISRPVRHSSKSEGTIRKRAPS